ncbi:18560_t:CDS:2, partial [Racocetra fulgida]
MSYLTKDQLGTKSRPTSISAKSKNLTSINVPPNSPLSPTSSGSSPLSTLEERKIGVVRGPRSPPLSNYNSLINSHINNNNENSVELSQTVKATDTIPELTQKPSTQTSSITSSASSSNETEKKTQYRNIDDIVNDLSYPLETKLSLKPNNSSPSVTPSENNIPITQERRNSRPISLTPSLDCAGCGKAIIGKVLNAMGKRWHPEHFNCKHCGITLEYVAFFEKDGYPYCHLDYHELFSPKCGHCGNTIEGLHRLFQSQQAISQTSIATASSNHLQKNLLKSKDKYKKKVFLTEKKLYFYIAYVNSLPQQGATVLEILRHEVEAEREKCIREGKEYKRDKETIEQIFGNKQHGKGESKIESNDGK